jgi:hypothetical protein
LNDLHQPNTDSGSTTKKGSRIEVGGARSTELQKKKKEPLSDLGVITETNLQHQKKTFTFPQLINTNDPKQLSQIWPNCFPLSSTSQISPLTETPNPSWPPWLRSHQPPLSPVLSLELPDLEYPPEQPQQQEESSRVSDKILETLEEMEVAMILLNQTQDVILERVTQLGAVEQVIQRVAEEGEILETPEEGEIPETREVFRYLGEEEIMLAIDSKETNPKYSMEIEPK